MTTGAGCRWVEDSAAVYAGYRACVCGLWHRVEADVADPAAVIAWHVARARRRSTMVENLAGSFTLGSCVSSRIGSRSHDRTAPPAG